jgi:hypothetical protein
LKASGLSVEQIRACGFYSDDDAERIGQYLGWNGPAKLGRCLVIPYPNADGSPSGYLQYRPDNPRVVDGRPRKYESPIGRPCPPYLPPYTRGVMGRADVTLVITEGAKKAAAVDQHEIACIGVSGVDGWRGEKQREGDPPPLAEGIKAFALKNRDVVVLFDNDAAYKDGPQWAEWELCLALAREGAIPRVAQLPVSPGEKVGADDFLAARGPEMLRRIIRSAGRPRRPDPAGQLVNFTEHEEDGKTSQSPKAAPLILARLRQLAGGWPRRVRQNLFVEGPGHEPRYLGSPAELFAYIEGRLSEAGGYGSRVRWVERRQGFVSKGEFFAHCTQTAEAFDAIAPAPHEPPVTRSYYMHPPLAGGDGAALNELLGVFRPATDLDHDLILAFLLTLAWGGPAGARPAFLFTGADGDAEGNRGIGKSTVPKLAGALFGGLVKARERDDFAALATRLLSPAAAPMRLILFDNLKTLKLSSAELEDFITAPVVSGRENYVGEGQRPNLFTVALTLNGASLGKDMAQRVVPVLLARPRFTGDWQTRAEAMVERKRLAILGDLVAHLRRPAQKLSEFNRYGVWEREILGRLPQPAAAQKLIASRQKDVDIDSEEAAQVRDEIVRAMREAGHDNPATAHVRFQSKQIAAIVNAATYPKALAAPAACAYLATLALPELVRDRESTGRFWVWRGVSVRDGPPVPFDAG